MLREMEALKVCVCVREGGGRGRERMRKIFISRKDYFGCTVEHGLEPLRKDTK